MPLYRKLSLITPAYTSSLSVLGGLKNGIEKALRNYNLGQNKMEQQTPTPPPQIKDAAARRAKTRHFPILDLEGEGGFRFSIYFV